jgi:hypothetical protein
MKNDLKYQTLQCEICNRIYQYHRRDTKGHTLLHCNSCKVNTRRFELKDRAIAYKGGGCSNCGYNKCKRALQFHHTDPANKEFQIGGHHTNAWSKIVSELDKCVLLCSNCHAEEHERLDLDVEKQTRRIAALAAAKPIQTTRKFSHCSVCKKEKSYRSESDKCRKCAKNIQWPSDETLKEMLEQRPATVVALELGVTSTAVWQHCQKRGIPKAPRGYWAKISSIRVDNEHSTEIYDSSCSTQNNEE